MDIRQKGRSGRKSKKVEKHQDGKKSLNKSKNSVKFPKKKGGKCWRKEKKISESGYYARRGLRTVI